MMVYLIEEYGARRLVSILLSRISELIEFRIAIDMGYIPIVVPYYNVSESKQLIGDGSTISSKSDFQFRRLARIASQTSLTDWICMKVILSNTIKTYDYSYNKVLFSLVSRTALIPERLDSDMLIVNSEEVETNE